MEGTVRPDEPIQSAEDEANLAQAEALNRLKVSSQIVVAAVADHYNLKIWFYSFSDGTAADA